MYTSPFKDYYQTLQVHHDASPDVIKAAYRKLSTLYHPDINGNRIEDVRMAEINEAYHILSDSERRAKYHRQWVSYKTNRSSQVTPVMERQRGLAITAKDILDQFFHALLTKNWKNAYSCLTLEDQERISIRDFQSWRDAVSSCFEIQDYRIQVYRSYNSCRILDTVYPSVTEFAVTVNETDLQTSQTSKDVSHKYVAYDGTSWKVCLGLRSLKQATMKFKLLAQRRENYDPLTLYRNAVSHRDPLTGLLSETGFYDDANKEVERHKRYNNPLSLAAFQIRCKDNSREIPCLCYCASIIRKSARINDIIARFGNNMIVCLLVETNENQAFLAVNKFVQEIKQNQTEPFQFNASILPYSSRQAIEDTVFAICSDVQSQGGTIYFDT